MATSNTRTVNRWTQQAMDAALRTFVVTLFLVATLFFVRRLTGGFLTPAPGWLVVALMALIVAATPLVSKCARQQPRELAQVAFRVLFSISAPLIVISLYSSLGNVVVGVLTWTGVLLVFFGCWQVEFAQYAKQLVGNTERPAEQQQPAAGSSATVALETPDSDSFLSSWEKGLLASELAGEEDVDLEAESHFPPEIKQQLVRSVEGNVETLAATLRGTLAANQRSCNLHIAICPPLAEDLETVEAYQLEGPPVTIKIAEQERYGIRLEVKLAAAIPEPIEFVVQCIAQAQPDS